MSFRIFQIMQLLFWKNHELSLKSRDMNTLLLILCELPKKSPPKQILGLMRNKKILKIRRFASKIACNRPDFMVK